jgi:tetratricopeptide (TPR) repeat protein
VDTSLGTYLWSETYDRKVEDLFAIQEDISQAIVKSLRVRLLGPGAGPSSRGSRNPAAYDLYLRGRFQWNKRTPDALDRAIEHFKQAIAADPQFAPAHAGLADAYTLRADYGLALPRDMLPKAKSAVLRALEIDPRLAEAHTSLGLICSHYEWQWAEAGEHYRRAIELNPGYLTARHWYSCDYLALLGRFEEAVSEIELALRLDPLSPVIHESRTYVLMLARRYDEALEKLIPAIELDPFFYKSYTALGRIYIQKGMYGRAIEMLQKGRSLAGDLPSVLGALGQAHALDGRPGEARAILSQLAEIVKTRYVHSSAFALIHCGLGEIRSALDWLETACERREFPVCALKVHPAYDVLRAEPRFGAMIARIGLVD